MGGTTPERPTPHFGKESPSTQRTIGAFTYKQIIMVNKYFNDLHLE
jgi:hypothetical protein